MDPRTRPNMQYLSPVTATDRNISDKVNIFNIFEHSSH